MSEQEKFQSAIKEMEMLLDVYDTMKDVTPGGYNTDRESIVMSIAALRAQQEQENPQPLTEAELRTMFGKSVYVLPKPVVNTESGHEYADPIMRKPRWGIVRTSWITCLPWEYADTHPFAYDFSDIGKLFEAYAHEPKGEHHGVGNG